MTGWFDQMTQVFQWSAVIWFTDTEKSNGCFALSHGQRHGANAASAIDSTGSNCGIQENHGHCRVIGGAAHRVDSTATTFGRQRQFGHSPERLRLRFFASRLHALVASIKKLCFAACSSCLRLRLGSLSWASCETSPWI